MGVISWIILGLIAGWIGSKIVNKTGSGMVMDIALGVVGAIVGGLIFSGVFGMEGVSGLNIWSLIVAVVGAVVVLWIYHMVVARTPARRRGIVGAPGFGPSFDDAVGANGALPEGGARLQEIHQHLGGGESFAAMRRSDGDANDLFARRDLPEAMDRGHADERPSGLGLARGARHLRLGHAGVVFELQHGQPPALVPAIADEAHHRTDVPPAVRERRCLRPRVEIFSLNPDRRHRR
jgi:uncharacterized membrane protein YeaQ/YmgE (transglycosylase-associated protein family)